MALTLIVAAVILVPLGIGFAVKAAADDIIESTGGKTDE